MTQHAASFVAQHLRVDITRAETFANMMQKQAILNANTHPFHISGNVKGNKATLLGELGWRDGRTLTVTTPLGDVDLQLPSAMPTDLRHVDHHVLLHDWNRGLARPVFRLA